MSDQALQRSATLEQIKRDSLQSGHFVMRRLKELSYTGFFAGVFLICQSPLHALVIDDIRVLSRLGENFQAEIVVTPAAGETLNRGCFSATPASGDLPGISNVRLSLTRQLNTQVLQIRSANPLREPLSEFVLRVKCPGVPTVVKSFLVMVDPPGLDDVQPATIIATAGAAASNARNASRPAARRTTTSQRRTVVNNPLTPGSHYTVANGDMLSTIAARVAGRPDWSVWPIAQHIYQANPGAFLLGDPNVIAMGSEIYIPRLDQIDFSQVSSGLRAAASPQSSNAATTRSSVLPAIRTAPQSASLTSTTRVRPAVITGAGTDTLAARAAAVGALPGMQLTAALFDESKMKLELRRYEVRSPIGTIPAGNAQTVSASPAATQAPAGNSGQPQSEPERPNSIATASREAIPATTAQSRGWLNWLLIAVGLIAALLIGAFGASIMVRQQLKARYKQDLRDALRIREQQDARVLPPEPEAYIHPDPNAADASALRPIEPVEIKPDHLRKPEDDVDLTPTTFALSDSTLEIGSMPGLDFQLPTDAPEADVEITVETPDMISSLDLELPDDHTGQSGQHEVDYDLLERAYSEEYQAEFVAPAAETPAAKVEIAVPDTASDAVKDDDGRYYHLENRDPADDLPLDIEMDDDDSGDESSDGKVVKFPKHSSSG